ncbi:MAG: hypothetical protein ACJ8C4_11095 [Gemmataceae bacterium]
MNEEIQVNELFSVFGQPMPMHQIISGDVVPEPYHSLLVHPNHMTLAVEGYYQGPVKVRVLDRHDDGERYARLILLERASDGLVVQFGIMRINLSDCPEAVRHAILAEDTPLGRILIEHDVMRRIEPTAFMRVEVQPPLATWLAQTGTTYGRLGFIHVNDKPAVELIEILAPIPPQPEGGR